jgi:CarD family transcriptional regulator
VAVKKAAAAPAKAAKPMPAKKSAPEVASKPAAAAKPAATKAPPPKPEVKAVPPASAAISTEQNAAPALLQTVQQKVVDAAAPPQPEPAPAAAPTSAAPQGDRRPMMPDRPMPRPMAKAEIFVEGDHVVYPTHGVGKVERIAIEEIAGHKLELIHITFEENRMTLRVPVAKARTAGLRKLATRKMFDEALAVLKGRARIKRTMWSRRAQEYEAKINSGDPLAIAEVVRDLHRNAGQPDQSFSERQIYEAAMDRLAAELAALDKTDKLTAATKLTNFLKTV